jgi:hypothetical protein
MIKSITQLGKDYGVDNPYENYGSLVVKCLDAAKKRKDFTFTWNDAYYDPKDIVLLPQFIPITKETEGRLDTLEFKTDPYLNKSPQEIRNNQNLIVETLAQFLDQYAQGDKVLGTVDWLWIDFAWEDIFGYVPDAFFFRRRDRAFLGRHDPSFRNGYCGVRSAVRESLVSEPFSSFSLPLELTINGMTYRRETNE